MAPFVQRADRKGIHCISFTLYFTFIFIDTKLLLQLEDIPSSKKLSAIFEHLKRAIQA